MGRYDRDDVVWLFLSGILIGAMFVGLALLVQHSFVIWVKSLCGC